MPSPKLVPLLLADDKRDALESLVRRRTASQSLAQRATIVLACAERGGTAPLTAVASEVGMSREMVRNGYCIRTVATGNTEWECTWTTLLPGGHLTVEGPFLDNGTNTTLAITGGTGRIADAEGSMLLHATGQPVGSEFDFIFTLTH
jgi:hypothetical protein